MIKTDYLERYEERSNKCKSKHAKKTYVQYLIKLSQINSFVFGVTYMYHP